MNSFKHICPIMLLLLAGIASANAQKGYEPVMGINDYVYYIKGELTLDYSSTLYFKEFDEKLSKKYHLVAPLYLNYNRNDLKYFVAEPEKLAGYTDAFLGTTNYFYDNRGENEKFAGMMQAEEWVKIIMGETVSEKTAKGNIDQPISIVFKMANFEDILNAGGKNYIYRLYISAASCPDCPQDNVSGWFETEGYRISDGITLDISFECGTTFSTDLVNHIIANNMESVGGVEKDKFEDQFEKRYFKTLPEIDAVKLIEFLINPKGVYEVPVSGYFNSPDGTSEKTMIKGTLKLYGDDVNQYWVEKPGE